VALILRLFRREERVTRKDKKARGRDSEEDNLRDERMNKMITMTKMQRNSINFTRS
jgi:hypothetical protein